MKKIALLIGLILALALVISSCTQDDMPEIASDQSKQQLHSEYYLSLSDALARIPEGMPFKDCTRSTYSIISSVELFSPLSTTRGEDNQEPGYYLVNFGDEEGFAILGADKRLNPVYAFSDAGSISLSDTLENEGLRLFFDMLPAGDELNKGLDTRSSSGDIGISGPTIDSTLNLISSWRIATPPLSTLSMRKWKDAAPFNLYCGSDAGGKKYKVGAAAVACALYMAYFQFPSSYKGHAFNWQEMRNNENNTDIAYLMKVLGEPENLDMTYSTQRSTCQYLNILRTFKNFGYGITQANPKTFSVEYADIYICTRNQPVFVYGKHEVSKYDFIWIIDGKAEATIVGKEEKANYYHCIWGRGNTNSGYFYYDTDMNKIKPYINLSMLANFNKNSIL